MNIHFLSKSTYMRGKQCVKSLYLNKYHDDLRDEITDAQQAIFDKGHQVGAMAWNLFPGGVDASEGDHATINRSVNYTRELIASSTDAIYEAAFIFDGVLCYMDILVKENGKWKAYEVKGSTGLKEYYIDDASLQYYVITNSGLPLEDISIVYLNNQYVRHGDIEPGKLFNIESVKEKVVPIQDDVAKNIDAFRDVLESKDIPDIDIGPHCTDPYSCDFMGYCWKDIKENSIFDISRLHAFKKFELYKRGIISLNDIPDDYPLNDSQWLQVKSFLNGKVTIREEEIKRFVSGLHYPLYFMDFETFQPAIPLFDNTRPYQQVPFQYSLHYLEKQGDELIHSEFLAHAGDDPREDFIESLIQDIGKEGDIIVYNRGFESRILREIAGAFPKYKNETERILGRIVDLMEPFQKKHYYSPEMRGSYSIKNVLPALVPKLSYSDLDITEGGMASLAFEGLIGETDLVKIAETRQYLLDYCKMDTLAMAEILKKLEEV